jgi:hypothetical protein
LNAFKYAFSGIARSLAQTRVDGASYLVDAMANRIDGCLSTVACLAYGLDGSLVYRIVQQ